MADTPQKTRVLIVDDDAPSRQIVAKDLSNYDWAEVCGTVSGARQLLSAASALKPDLIFLDIELDDQSALDFIPRLKTVVPRDCLELVLERCEARAQVEKKRMAEIRQGQVTAAGILAKLEKAGY